MLVLNLLYNLERVWAWKISALAFLNQQVWLYLAFWTEECRPGIKLLSTAMHAKSSQGNVMPTLLLCCWATHRLFSSQPTRGFRTPGRGMKKGPRLLSRAYMVLVQRLVSLHHGKGGRTRKWLPIKLHSWGFLSHRTTRSSHATTAGPVPSHTTIKYQERLLSHLSEGYERFWSTGFSEVK